MTADIIEHPGGRRRPDQHVERSPARYWMKHDVKAFAFETATADAEGAGALILLRGHYFITGSLPKTDAECSKVCRLSARKFARIRPWLFSFFDLEGKSADLDASIEETERIIETRRDAGRKGGTGKALAFAKQTPKQNPRQSESQLESELQEEKQLRAESTTPAPSPPPSWPRAREGDELAAEVLASLPIGARAHPVWRGLNAWMAQLLTDGSERVDIVVGFAECMRSLQDRPPNSLSYFSAAIGRAQEARARLRLLSQKHPVPNADQHQLGDGGEILRKSLGDDVFASWFGSARLVSVSGDTATISVASAFKRTWIISNFDTVCIAAFKRTDPSIDRVDIVVDDFSSDTRS